MGRNTQETRRDVQPEVTRHPTAARKSLRRLGFQIRKPGARNLQRNLPPAVGKVPEAGGRTKCGDRSPNLPSGRDTTETALSVTARWRQGNSLLRRGSRTQEPANGRSNSPRFRVFS